MTRPPDLLLILTDQFNPRMVGFAGDPVVRTPHLDALAREGTVFSAAYTASPVCMPARCSLVSGRYPHNHGVWGNVEGRCFPAHEATLFRAVRDAGYTTAKIGKFHYHLPQWGESFADYAVYYASLGLDWAQELPEPYHAPFFGSEYREHLRRRGLWDAFLKDMAWRFEHGDHSLAPNPLPPDDHADSFVARQAIAYIDRAPHDTPLFLCVSFPGPHSPIDAPGEYATMFAADDILQAPNVPDIVLHGGRRYSRSEMRAMQANYYGKIALIDRWIGQLSAAMRQRGTWDDALVIFTADHGEYMGSHGRLAKGGFEEESARVPLVLRWPGRVRAGITTGALAGHLDVYQTILAAAGAPRPPGTFGRSLLPLARGEIETGGETEGDEGEAVFSEIARQGRHDYMVRTNRYKWFIRDRESLFDLQEDPFEQVNLAGAEAYHEVQQSMRERLRQFLMQTQVNHSAAYQPLFTRVGIAAGQRDIAARMLDLFHRLGRSH